MMLEPDKFATFSLRRLPQGNDICQLLATAIESADAGFAIKNNVSLDADHLLISNKSYDLSEYKRVFVIGAGKAAAPMANAIYATLGHYISDGIVITKDGYLGVNKSILEKSLKFIEAGHPIPDQRNLVALSHVISMIHNLKIDDLVICLFSGGGSSLLMKPTQGISLKNIQDTTSLLLKCGASIYEINTVRKHLDEIKGGNLARLLFPATVITFLLSDVVGDDLDMVASGPTIADSTTFKDAWAIMNKYQMLDQIPSQVRSHISNGMEGNLPETLKPGDPLLDNVQNFMVGNNTQTALAAVQAANALGFTTKLLTTSLHGEASQVGRSLAESAKSLLTSFAQKPRPACLVAGGETTVTIQGTGLGGRNQELALGAVKTLSEEDQMILVSLATDGEDGSTDAAGAVATSQTYSRGLSIGLDPIAYLQRNDSYHYFVPLGDLIKTGPTLTNVNDLVFIFGV